MSRARSSFSRVASPAGEANPFQWVLSIIYQEKGGLKIIGCYFLHGSTISFDAKERKNHPFDNTRGGAEREKENGSNCLISSPSYLQQPKSSSEKAETTLRMTTKRNVLFLCVIIRDIHALARMFKREIKLI